MPKLSLDSTPLMECYEEVLRLFLLSVDSNSFTVSKMLLSARDVKHFIAVIFLFNFSVLILSNQRIKFSIYSLCIKLTATISVRMRSGNAVRNLLRNFKAAASHYNFIWVRLDRPGIESKQTSHFNATHPTKCPVVHIVHRCKSILHPFLSPQF